MDLTQKNTFLIKGNSQNKIKKEIKKYTGEKHIDVSSLMFLPEENMYINFEDNSIGFNLYLKNGSNTGIYAFSFFDNTLIEKYEELHSLLINSDDDGYKKINKDSSYFSEILCVFQNLNSMNAYTNTGQSIKIMIKE